MQARRSLPRRAARLLICVAVVCLGIAGCGGGSRASTTASLVTTGHIATLHDPISRSNLTDLPFGDRSDWLQPWRAYMTTVPAATLRQAIGINYDIPSPRLAPLYAALLSRAGFHRVRLEIGWDQLDDGNPSRLAPADLQALAAKLRAFKRYGIRPLILLNANDTGPTPMHSVALTLTAPAAAGATAIQLTPSDAAKVTANQTGIRLAGDHRAVSDMITSVAADGTATLSIPLAAALPAGPVEAETLLAAPFSPMTVNGQPNPVFQATLNGWLNYVGVVTSTVKRILGDEDFDVEIWNELTFGSSFLNPVDYWAGATKADYKAVRAALLAQTVTYLRDPANGVASIGIGDGFTNTQPFGSGANQPAGITAIDKHPYAGPVTFPKTTGTIAHQDSVGALGGATSFSPDFTAFLPEWFLTGLQTETLVRDLAPFSTDIHHTPHGRYVHAATSLTAPRMWITEVNLNFAQAARKLGVSLTSGQLAWLEAKAVLRYFTAYVNKGVTALYLYALDARHLSVFNPTYQQALKRAVKRAAKQQRRTHRPHAAHTNAGIEVSVSAAGPAAVATSRLSAALQGAEPIPHPRQLSLDSIGEFRPRSQFTGTSDPNTPTLWNRDVFAVLPFEVTPKRFVIPYYVMTRNMLQVQRPREPSTATTRFDLPAETFRLTLGNLPSCRLSLSATDPMYGSAVPVREVSCHGGTLVADVSAVDYPRLLTLSLS